jgi:hypothetical protein
MKGSKMYGKKTPAPKVDHRSLPLFGGGERVTVKGSANAEGFVESKSWMCGEWWYVVNGTWEPEACLQILIN